jgi:hypothetical protein
MSSPSIASAQTRAFPDARETGMMTELPINPGDHDHAA